MDFRFFFYSNDHSPIHVHVRKGDGEEGGVVLWESQGLKIKELSRAQELPEESKMIIVEKWHEHFS
jgi:hypothetical protein